MKRLVSLAIAIMMIVCSITVVNVSAESTSGMYTYTVSDGKATITKCDTSAATGSIVIPSTLDGYPVVSIGDNAFSYCYD